MNPKQKVTRRPEEAADDELELCGFLTNIVISYNRRLPTVRALLTHGVPNEEVDKFFGKDSNIPFQLSARKFRKCWEHMDTENRLLIERILSVPNVSLHDHTFRDCRICSVPFGGRGRIEDIESWFSDDDSTTEEDLLGKDGSTETVLRTGTPEYAAWRRAVFEKGVMKGKRSVLKQVMRDMIKARQSS